MLSTIGRVLKLNLNHRSGRDSLKETVEQLDRKLRRIQVTVEEVGHREIHDEAAKLWLQELKCLATDAEDVLDEYNYEILRCQIEFKQDRTTTLSGQLTGMESNSAMVTNVSSCFSESLSLHMTERIRKINSRFDEISRDRKALGLTNEEGKRRHDASSVNLSSTSHLMNKDDIFGRTDDKDKIIDLLFPGVFPNEEKKDHFRVIPIVGMGGIGKTTLAQMVYHDLSVQHRFDVKAWVHVTPEFDIIRITKEISEFVTGKPGRSFDGFSKINEVLRKKLKGNRMLLVLDDVWNVLNNDWETLYLSLRTADLVRVLVTSRNDAVAQAPYAVPPHRLDILPEDDCLKLLYHCAFGGKEIREKQWSLDIDRQIIKKCGGLPLAIKCIGRVLHYDTDKYHWRELLDSELWESDELDPIFCALKVSYYHLAPKLRDCFLFCSLFPKGSILRKMSIIYMWMAHGFLQPKGTKRAEDIGEEYLAELQMRSFIVPCTKGGFRLHDVIHDLARFFSGGEIHAITDTKSIHIPDTIRHLYIKKGIDSCQSFKPQWLRTMFNATVRTEVSFLDLYDISSVRVLGLIGSNVLALAHLSLKHLRYLGIMEFSGKTLPESLCLLYHLQTLEITHCYHLRELPTNIANLVSLRYIHITHVGIKELPVMLWEVRNLQTLRLRECYNLRMVPLGISKLINLHVLQIKSCKQLQELPDDTGNLDNLSLLDLSYSGIRKFPDSILLLKSTTKLVLVGEPFFWLPHSVRKQLNCNLVQWSDNGFNRFFCEDTQAVIEGLIKYPSKRQKLIHFRSQLWQKIRIVGKDSFSQITWMSSHNQSSTLGIMSSQCVDDARTTTGSYEKC
ncbi:hypothetical protein LUZ61_008772 [Rhynchospora tenuis]|uniref:Uncharacterized protein n=1 Tax=Rhynchospora tenuis TaxID=198213 RepID=A0AAD5ZW61_9POAL|nr:hypothetical protein LUZ61_008772 [Rhynchospora tenuis]